MLEHFYSGRLGSGSRRPGPYGPGRNALLRSVGCRRKWRILLAMRGPAFRHSESSSSPISLAWRTRSRQVWLWKKIYKQLAISLSAAMNRASRSGASRISGGLGSRRLRT